MKQERVHEIFSQTAVRMGDALAVNYGDSHIRYGELEKKSNNLANFLIASGATKGEIVAILAEDGVEIITAMIAVMKAGCVFVPLDPNLPEKRLMSMAAEAPPKWFIVELRYLDRIPLTPGARVICVDAKEPPDSDRGDLTYLKEFSEYRNVESPDVISHPDDMCYVYFTSDSTGRPKGIAGRLKSIDHFVKWEIETFGVGNGTKVSQLTSPAFDAYLRDVFVPLCAGGVVCGMKGVRNSLDVKALIDWIDSQEINLIHCVPSLFRSILSYELKSTHFSALKHVLLAGEPVLPSDVRKWTDVFGDRVQLVNLYGPSETTMTKLFYMIKPSDRDHRSIPIGKPMPGAKAMIIGPEGKPCPPGLVGEIYIRTPFRSLGYYNRPDLTREAFIPNSYTGDPDDLIYRTGDLGRVLKDGNFEFLGRKDQQVKIRGIRVELREIENLLLDHPLVKEAAVVDRDDESGNKCLCAYVVCAKDVDVSALKDYLALSLPDYMAPSFFMIMRALPRTTTGKIDRRALPSIAKARAAAGRAYIGPRTPVEEALAQIWSQILGLEKIGVDKNFFEIGGRSLTATQVISQVNAAFDVELPLQAMFEFPTLGDMAGRVEIALRGRHKFKAPAITRADRGQRMPLSYAQQRLWFVEQLDPGSASYNIPLAVRLKGRLNGAALRQSINEVVRRHEALRMVFSTYEGRPIQEIQPAGEIDLPIVDLSGLAGGEREAAARRMVEKEAGRGFDLSSGPVLRVMLGKLEEEDHVLAVTMHHIVSDGWSTVIWTKDVALLYEAYCRGERSPLPELVLQYVDFAAWQRGWLEGEVLQEQLRYWREKLEGVEVLELPTDRPRAKVAGNRGGSAHYVLSEKVTDGLKEISQREGATLFMTLLAAFQILLGRYSGQDDIVVGTDVANRNHIEIEEIVGFFVNQLVLRGNLCGDPTFKELLGRVREITIGAYAHQDLPFENLVDELGVVRDLSRNPLFQVMLSFQHIQARSFEIDKLTLAPFEIKTGVARLDVEMQVIESGKRLSGALLYNRDLFDDSTMSRLLDHFQTLLNSIMEAPDRNIAELEMLSAAERRQLLIEWNDTASYFPQEERFDQLFEAQVDRAPEAIAVVFAEQHLSYSELDRGANRLAQSLSQRGIGMGALVGLLSERGIDLLTAILAVFKAGGAYLPLDPRYPATRLAQVVGQSGTPLVLTQARFKPLLSDSLAHLPGATTPQVEVLEELFQSEQSDIPLATRSEAGGVAYVIYTSGSTGVPKGAMIGHKGMLNHLFVKISTLGLTSADAVAQTASQCFDISVWQFLAALMTGGRINIFDDEIVQDGLRLLYEIDRQGISIVETVPSLALVITDEVARRSTRRPELAALRWMIVTGEALPPELYRSWAALYPAIPMLNAYGPTECSDDVTHFPIFGEAVASRASIPIGRAVSNIQLYILDRRLQPVPAVVPGELYVGGVGVGLGYLKEPSRTAESFIPNPFGANNGDRLYRTGDLVRYLPDGNIEFLGRIDNQVKIRGYRIETGEIESTLEQHPDIRQAIVLAREEVTGEMRLIAYVVPRRQKALVIDELRSFLKMTLPIYMVPPAIICIDSLPLNPNGKVDRKALPAPDQVHSGTANQFVPPTTTVEKLMAEIWAEVLNLDQVGISDNFFELGGHSLLAMQLMSRVREVFHIDPPLRTLFESPTIANFICAIAVYEAQQAEADEVARMLAELEQLPGDQIQSLLTNELQLAADL